jgi:hypothetical protein
MCLIFSSVSPFLFFKQALRLDSQNLASHILRYANSCKKIHVTLFLAELAELGLMIQDGLLNKANQIRHLNTQSLGNLRPFNLVSHLKRKSVGLTLVKKRLS